ncbi:hypothetical protein [Nonlabens sp. Asnod2-A12]|uniref:hypothetical protein n=1 Tax=Nonlabens sp. Asnod2-A12 TaxID=3160578 RepID=UPI003869435E
MHLSGHNIQLKNPSWNFIQAAIKSIVTHLILTNKNGDYVQCIRNAQELIIEYRVNSNSKFKHFVIGRGENKSPLKVTWIVIQTTSGEIMVQQEEILKFSDAELIFKEFYNNNSISGNFNKRNVTKLHL